MKFLYFIWQKSDLAALYCSEGSVMEVSNFESNQLFYCILISILKLGGTTFRGTYLFLIEAPFCSSHGHSEHRWMQYTRKSVKKSRVCFLTLQLNKINCIKLKIVLIISETLVSYIFGK